MEPQDKKWQVHYLSDGQCVTIAAERFVDTGDWVDFLRADGTVVQRERASGIARITLKRERGNSSPSGRSSDS